MSDLVSRVAGYIENSLKNEGTGHDWWHIYRVWQMAGHISRTVANVNTEIVELAALLHDVPDYKFHNGDKKQGSLTLRRVMDELEIPPEIYEPVFRIATNVSFLGAGVRDDQPTVEGQIVQDADRLDAMAAIGIARCFIWGAVHGEPMYDPDIPVRLHASQEEYIGYQSTSINHFYEKLLLLKDRLHTAEAKRIGQERHDFLVQFVSRFEKEWEGKV